MKVLHKALSFTLIICILGLGISGCAKNPDTGKYEPDYVTIANITKVTSQSLTFELLKYLHEGKPDEVSQAYAEFVTAIAIIQRYADGDITAGETATSVVEIFQRLQARFDIPDSPITSFVTSTVAALSGALNMVLTTVPENASLILTAAGNGLNDGLNQYQAWAGTQTAGLMP